MRNIHRSIAGAVTLAVLLACGIIELGAHAPAQQPELKTLSVTFVPGEKTLFYDDFSDMAPGDVPRHFKARGAAPELKEADGVRQLTFSKNGSLAPILGALPANFTFESEVLFEAPQGIARLFVVFYSKEREAAAWSIFCRATSTDMTVSRKLPKFEELGRKAVKADGTRPLKLALWIQDGRLRVFVNGEKQVDVNQIDLPPLDRVELRAEPTGVGAAVGLRSVRFAETAPDFSQVIAASGRYASHSIRFDTNSDRLKPESAGAIQMIATALDANPALKLLIEGHTDAVGTAAANLDLSRRRAEAVKTVIVSQFNIDPSRLATNGLGSTKPIDSNETPLGRAQNRRVEFVRQ